MGAGSDVSNRTHSVGRVPEIKLTVEDVSRRRLSPDVGAGLCFNLGHDEDIVNIVLLQVFREMSIVQFTKEEMTLLIIQTNN